MSSTLTLEQKIIKEDNDLRPAWPLYEIIGRAKPTEAVPQPEVFRMKIYAKTVVHARSRFWYYIRSLKKVKKSHGQILSVEEIHEDNQTLQNFGVMLRYDSRSGTHNMYKEYRDTCSRQAVAQMYAEMAGMHRARNKDIHIIGVWPVKDEDIKRSGLSQYVKPDLSYPKLRSFKPRGYGERLVRKRVM